MCIFISVRGPFSVVLTNVATSPPSGVRNYLKEALVNIITVHAEVKHTNKLKNDEKKLLSPR